MSDREHLPAVPAATPLAAQTPVLPATYFHPGLSLAQIFAIVWAYRGQIIAIMASVALITVLAVMFWPRTYSATATLIVNYEVNDPTSGRELPAGLLSNFIATQIDLMQDLQLRLDVVDRLKLTERKFYMAGYNGDGSTRRQWAARVLGENLTITPSKSGSQMIYVSYDANSAEEAAEVANTVAEIYRELAHRHSTEPSERAKRSQLKLEALQTRVVEAQQQLTEFHQANGLIDPEYKTNSDINVLSELETRLLEAQNARRIAEARAAADQAVGDQVMTSPLWQTLKTQLAAQEARLAELQISLGPRHPQIIELRTQIAATRRSLEAEQGHYAANAREGLRMARQLEGSLQKAVNEQRGRVLAIGQLREEASKYQLELESAQAMYKRAIEEHDQLMVAARSRYTNVSLVSPATPPLKPSKPRALRTLALGFVAAGMLGFGLPLIRELLGRRVRCRDDLERDLGVPVLAEFNALRGVA